MTQWWDACLVWAPGMCISRKFPDHAHAAGVGGHIMSHRFAESLMIDDQEISTKC